MTISSPVSSGPVTPPDRPDAGRGAAGPAGDVVGRPVGSLGQAARMASRVVARASSAARDAAIGWWADALERNVDQILEANRLDVARAAGAGMDVTGLDRLRLDEDRVAGMATGLRRVAAMADPVGEVVDGWVRPNGLQVTRVRVPLGVIGVIYENRPNVTSDAAGLSLKAGNATMLRGSGSAIGTNSAIVALLRDGLAATGLPADAVVLLEDTSHRAAVEFMQLQGIVDCLIPRGGHELVDSVRTHATVPYVIDGDGNCHLYVDASADLDQAEEIAANAKMQRPGVCNSIETLLVHDAVADAFLPRVARRLAGVTLVGDEGTRRRLPDVGEATEEDYATEFLGMRLAVAVVDSLDAAVDHIHRYGSGHSEAIVTRDLTAADAFTSRVDAAAVVVNASTRFVDGEELGLGAEIGISTQKLHARGPMGLRELTCIRYVLHGNGQVRT
ncbi:MAG: glutamate-5-semialdehyde dehydrogenase [Actinomycetota bacterium]|nr:glutamate-5-semialdehyde dehydrogenase [Actinomycetota bacterium]